MNMLTKEFDFEIANWYYKKILHQTVITNRSITEKKLKFLYFSGSRQLYLLHGN